MDPIQEIKEANAIVAEEVAKGDGRDKDRLAQALRRAETAVKALEAPKGSDGPGELEAWKAHIQRQIDAAVEQVRSLHRVGLVARADGTARPKDLWERRRMLAEGRCFANDEMAERFGALVCFGKLHGGAPPRTREIAEDVLKDVDGVEKAVDWDPTVSGSGGALIPDEFLAELIRNVETMGKIYPLFRRVPLVTLGDTTVPRRTGGMTAYWVAAGADITQSGVTLATVTLSPKKLAGLTGIPNEFFRSRALAAIGQFAGMEILYSMRYALDDAVVNGDGTADYGNITGILDSGSGLSTVTLTADHDAGSEVDESDLDEIEEGLSKDYAIDNARWLMSPTMITHCKNIRNADGLRVVWDGGDRITLPATINGYPYTFSSRFPAKASIGASTEFCAFGDPALSHILGMLQDMRLDMSPAPWYASDATAVRGIAHVNVQEADTDAMVKGKTHA